LLRVLVMYCCWSVWQSVMLSASPMTAHKLEGYVGHATANDSAQAGEP
jgi:hypothetical protein